MSVRVDELLPPPPAASSSDYELGGIPGSIDHAHAPAAASGSVAPTDVLLTVNPAGKHSSATGAYAGRDSVSLMREASANTGDRRISATQVQNEAQWQRMQEGMGDRGEESDDIASRFSQQPRTPQQQQLRPSAQQRASMVASPSASSPVVEHASAAEWEAHGANSSSSADGASGGVGVGRAASASQSFLSGEEQRNMRQLPPEFTGAAKLVMPRYLTGQISNVTLPSRLDLLGRRGFKLLGAIFPRRVGNSVLGWSPVLTTSWSTHSWRIRSELFILPFVFSKSMAKILLYLHVVLAALLVIFALDVFEVADVNTGRVWAVGTVMALGVMFQQSRYRRAPDGVMAFCRSMGVPEVEEYMFSYCWKEQPDNVRTLAKAVWKAGVGVWIDVVKLCPGDEIRPMVRTTVRRVHKVVVFLCDEYCQSMNCCVEMMEAIQHPEKVTICIIKDNIQPAIMQFLLDLKPKGLRMCVGFDELMQLLDLDIQDMTDLAAFHWWRSQAISGAGVPDNLVPSAWPLARFSLRGRWVLPEKSVDVGPVYLSGDCKTTGASFSPPWLLIIALVAVGINVYDMWSKYAHSSFLHTSIDYVFLGVIAGCNCAPFIGLNYLLDRRRDAHVALRPLLASRSMGKEGVKVRVVGAPADPIFHAVRAFLEALGHLASDADTGGDGDGSASGSPSSKKPAAASSRCVTVYIMESLARRDEMFGPAAARLDNRFSLFIWSGSAEAPGVIPFTEDQIGQRLMRYLVLVVEWEKHGLAESLFSAIGVRVVDILHEKPSRAESLAAGGSAGVGAGGMGSTLRLAGKSHAHGSGPAGGHASSYGSFASEVHAVAEAEEEEEEATVGGKTNGHAAARLRPSAPSS